MVDKITLQRIELLHPKLRDEVTSIYTQQIAPALTGDYYCRFAYTLRTFEEQDQLYAQGRTKLFNEKGERLGIITNAKAGASFHNYGLALDIVLISGKAASWNVTKDYDQDGISDWMEIVNIFKKNGWTWGGDFKTFKDYPHFEKTFGLTWKECFKLYSEGKKDKDNYIIF